MQKFIFLFCCCLTMSLYAQQSNVFNVDHIKTVTAKYKLSPADVADYAISDDYVSSTSGVRNVYLQQQYQGIGIYNAILGIHIAPNGNVIHTTSQFLPQLTKRINNTTATLRPEEALAAAAQHLNIGSPVDLRLIKEGAFNQAGISENEIPFHLIYQLTETGQLRLCWNFIIKETKSPDWWDLRVDANTGQVLDQTNWTVTCNWDHGGFDNPTSHKHSAACSTGHSHHTQTRTNIMNPDSYNVYPLGIESPNHGSRAIVTDPANLDASPYAWHDTNGSPGAEYTITRGNNVYAYEDRNNTNSAGFSPDGGANLDFDFTLDPTQSPVVSESAVITNLFYWNNIMHDVWYQYGFDEASGNFQTNNYGNGGAGGDPVLAEAQDGSGTNNANFSAPGDGSSGRMQMFLWSGVATTNFNVNAPGSIAGSYFSVVGSFGPSAFNVTGDLAIVDDGSAAPAEGCGALVNGTDVSGKIAVVDRGNCEFGLKALNAQNAGAIAVIVCNNVPGDPIAMAPGTDGANVTIPSVMISQSDCQTIRVEVPTVSVTISASGAAVDFDSDLDNGIIAHEYGHGISIRLTGGASNSGCLSNSEQMGEGWSDWLGLMLTMNEGDVGTTGRGVGSYVLGQPTSGAGIRPHRYSTDMAVNPHTYNDIGSEAIPHGVGSVWCAMIWEMTWALIEQEGFDPDLYNGTGGNNIAMTLVIEGMKLQGCSPGFVDGRDGILAADQILYGGQYSCLIWSAFAKRGLGFSASQGNSGSATDGSEAFNMPPSCSMTMEKAVDKLSAAPGDTLTYTITVTNASGATLNNVVASDDLPANTIYVEGSASDGGSLSGSTVIFPAITLAADETKVYTFSVQVNPVTDATPYSTLEDAESTTGEWTSTATAPTLGTWAITGTNPYEGAGVWFAPDVDSPDEQYLTISNAIMPSATSVFKFWHSFDTEVNWDGGLVQISTDGLVWQDLGAYFTQNPYTDIIDNDPNFPGFSGNSNGYIESIIDLSAFADQTVFVRFWMHCDPAVGGLGWYIDNIELTGLQVIIPNTATASADGLSDVSASLPSATILAPCTTCTHCDNGVQDEDELGVDCGGALCEPCIEGCTDPAAHNYDPTAQLDDGSCETCTDGILNGDEIAIDCGGALCEPCIEGCTDSLAHNYDATAQIDDGSCETCTDGILNGDEIAIDCGGALCEPCAEGCTDPAAHNYDATAQVDDGSCETCTDGVLNGDEIAIDCGGTLCEPCIEGCTDSLAHNYDATAQIDDGSCETCTDGILNGDETEIDCGGTFCLPCDAGCTDPDAHNYDRAAEVDDGSCETCTDGILNGDEIAIDCGGVLCEPCIEGCTDSLTHNYDAMAQVDNGSCETCDDGIKNGDELGVDCGGALCGPCPPPCTDILAFSDPFIGNTLEYRANIQIQSTSTLSGNSDIYFIAADNVLLEEGFEVELGSTFLGDIAPCDGPSALNLNGTEAGNPAARLALENNNTTDKVTLNVMLTEPGAMKFSLYNLVGNLVLENVQEENLTIGQHTVIFGVEDLPSGVYQLVSKIGKEQFVTRVLID